jgi:hypothetical protein
MRNKAAAFEIDGRSFGMTEVLLCLRDTGTNVATLKHKIQLTETQITVAFRGIQPDVTEPEGLLLGNLTPFN